MTKPTAALGVLGLLAVAFVIGWCFRWQVIYAGKDSAYILNRWTGEVRWLVEKDWRPVEELKPTGPWGSYDQPAKP